MRTQFLRKRVFFNLSDGHHERITFPDVVGLLPKSWQSYEGNYIKNELFY